MSLRGASIGLQVMDEATGDWLDVGGIQEATSKSEPEEASVVVEPQSWTLTGTVTTDPHNESIVDYIARLAREARWARRAWLTHPYRTERIHP